MPTLCAVLVLCLLQLSYAFSLQPCHLLCQRGHCQQEKCVCDPCYSGANCSQRENSAPQFSSSSRQYASIDAVASGAPLATAAAVDAEAAKYPLANCSAVQYQLASPSTDFTVDAGSGEVRAARSNLPPGEYEISIRAANVGEFSDAAAETVVTVVVEQQQQHSRQRRSSVAAPSSVTFEYKQTYPAENKTHLRMGEKLAFEVTITFPYTTTSMNMEMFSPDNETAAVIMICDAQIKSVGKNLNVNAAAVMAAATYEGKGSSKWPYVRIVLPLGDVVNNDSSGVTLADHQIVVSYEAVFLYNDFVVNDSEFWVSAGAEYNNETVIWIGQTSFKANMDATNVTTPVETPSMNITGDDMIYPGRVSLYNLDIAVPYLSSNFTVDVFGPLNNSELLSICGIFNKDSGSGFGCVPRSEWPFNFTMMKQRPQHINYYRSMLSFTATKYTNKAFRMSNATPEDHRLSLSFALTTNQSATSGSGSYIGATVDFGAEVLTGYKTVTVGASTAASPNTTSVDPNITMTRLGPQLLAPKQATMYELTIDTVPGSVFDYEIQALMPANNSLARMKVCSLNITYAGRNLPCLGLFKSNVDTSFQILYSNGSVPADQYDYAVIRLPYLINVGTVPTDKDPLANRIVVKMVAVTLNHTLNVPDESAHVTMGVTYADRQWISISQVNFSTTANISSLANESLPQVNMFYFVGDENFNVGETAVVEVVTTLRRSVTYEPMDFEFIAPYQNGSAVMTVCSFQILSVGKNIGCSDRNSLGDNIRLTSKANSSVYDKAVFSLGTTSNVGTPGENLTADDQIRMRFSVKMLSHPSQSNGTVYFLSYGFQFSNDQIWIGQLPAMVQDPPRPMAALATGSEPLLAFELGSSSAHAGQTVLRPLLLKLARSSLSKYSLHIQAPSFASLCTVTVVSVGQNVSCPNDTEIRDSMQRTTFGPGAKEFLTSNATVQLGFLHNAADPGTLSTDRIADADTIVLRVIVTIDEGAAIGSGDLVATVYHEGTAAGVEAKETISVAAGSPALTATNSTPSFTLNTAPLFDGLNETTVYAPGQGFRAVLKLTTIPDVNSKISVQFVSPVNNENQLDILNVSVFSAGQNNPCVVPWSRKAVITKRNDSKSSDYGKLDLGVVCNTQLGSAAEDNEVQVEVIGRVWTNSSVFPNGELPLNCLVFLNDQQIFVQTLNITVDANAQAPQYTANSNNTISASFVSSSALQGAIGSDIEVALNVQVPEFISSVFRVDVRNAELNGSAWATVNKVNITYSGENLVGLSNEPYLLQLNSTQGTYQRDVGTLMVYSLQNSGLTTRSGTQQLAENRNNFTIVFNVKVADPLPADNGTVFQLSVGLQALDRIIIGLRDVHITRTGAEMPDSELQVNVSALPNAVYKAGDLITVTVNVTSANLSTAEMQDSVLFLHTPPYIRFVDFVNVSFESGSISQQDLPNAGMKFVFNNTIFFKETVLFSFTISMKDNVTLPGGRETANATSVYEMTYRMHLREGATYSGKWLRKAGSVHFTVRANSVPPSQCFGDLGMNDSAVIKDCQISSFMDPFTGFESHKVRPNAAGWKPHVRGDDYKNLRFVTVRFGELKLVSRIIVYQTGDNKPTCLNVYKTKDGRAFSRHQSSIPIASLYSNGIANVSLSKNLLGRGIRIGICGTTNGSDSEVTVRLGLEGCNYTSGPDFYKFDACTRRPYDEGRCGRSYLVSQDNTTMFYCDYVVTNTEELAGSSKCFKASTANPRKWQYLGPAVGSLLAHQPSTNRLFGKAQGCTGDSYVVSDDGGDTWKVTNPQAYHSMRNSPLSGVVTLSNSVEWKLTGSFQPGVSGVSCDTYAAGDWRLCYDGIYHTTNQVVSWNSCCLR